MCVICKWINKTSFKSSTFITMDKKLSLLQRKKNHSVHKTYCAYNKIYGVCNYTDTKYFVAGSASQNSSNLVKITTTWEKWLIWDKKKVLGNALKSK